VTFFHCGGFFIDFVFYTTTLSEVLAATTSKFALFSIDKKPLHNHCANNMLHHLGELNVSKFSRNTAT
jgi:hypothetical protein